MEETRPCHAVLPDAPTPCADMRILWDLPLLQQRVSSAALEERAQDRLQAQGRVDFALFNIPRIAKS
jgi:hypothetical protein